MSVRIVTIRSFLYSMFVKLYVQLSNYMTSFSVGGNGYIVLVLNALSPGSFYVSLNHLCHVITASLCPY